MTADPAPTATPAHTPTPVHAPTPVHTPAAVGGRREPVLRRRDWILPPPPARREVVTREPETPTAGRPPLLFVHGAAMGAWAYADGWLDQAAARGWRATALSLRGHGGSETPQAFARTPLRHYEHDVLQVITEQPSPPVLIGHALGAQVVLGVLERYRSAPAGVLLAPPGARGGLEVALPLARHEPRSLLATLVGRSPLPATATLFGPHMDPAAAEAHRSRLGPESLRAGIDLVLPRRVRDVRAPLLVIGGEADRTIPPWSVVRTARRYGTRAHVFRGMGHSLMLEPGADDVLALLLDWVDEVVTHPMR